MAVQNDPFIHYRKPVIKFNPLTFGHTGSSHSGEEDYQRKRTYISDTKLSYTLKIQGSLLALMVPLIIFII